MFFSSQVLQDLLIYSRLIIKKLSKPNPSYFEDKIEYEMAYTRHRSIVIFNLFLLFIFTIEMLFGNLPCSVSMGRLLVTVAVCFILGFSSRHNPQIFKMFYSLMCLSYGPLFVNSPDEEDHQIWFSPLIFPLLTYVFTASVRHFLFQAIMQLLYVNRFYTKLTIRTVNSMTPEEFSRAFINALNVGIVVSTGLIMLAHYFMQTVYKRISIAEKRKEEVENQKTFLLGFSHELRNLINSLTGNVKLAGLESLNHRAKELLLNAEVCGELLLHLVNNILDTGKVEIGELEINSVPTRVYDTLERTWSICSELIRRKKLTGKISLPKDLPKILMIDHYRLTQIFLNLVGNAIKFTEQGGSIDITVQWLSENNNVEESCFQPFPFNFYDDHDEGLFEKQKILNGLDKSRINLDLRSRKIDRNMLIRSRQGNKGILKVSISDSGCGMSQNETEKLFQKFTQVTSDAAKRKLGTGLGLFITKQLCERMQGEVRVYSQKGTGSSFIFCIPVEVVHQESENVLSTESTKSILASRKLKAMIVDDIPFNQAILKSFYEKLGIEVIDIAANGLEAWQKYLEHVEKGDCPQIVTMDLDMPIVNGKKAAQKIRQIERERKLKPCFMPIISGNCSESEIAECLDQEGEIKANTFLKKPATIDEILRATGNYFINSLR